MKLKCPELRIEPTNHCNLHCKFCPRESLTRSRTTMRYRHFQDLVDQGVDLGVKLITLIGYGEPLIDKEIIAKTQYTSDNNLESFITTNATLMDKDMSDSLLDAGLSRMRFSVHGIAEEYEVFHNAPWQKTMDNIEYFLLSSEGRCEVDITIMPSSGVYSILDYTTFWNNLGVDKVEIWNPHNWTDGKKYRDVIPTKKTCGRPFNGPVQINADGKMIVCCFDYDGKIEVGDTHKNTIEEILKGYKFNRVREAHRTGVWAGLICEQCDQRQDDSPLLYSTVDKTRSSGKTSSMKFELEEN